MLQTASGSDRFIMEVAMLPSHLVTRRTFWVQAQGDGMTVPPICPGDALLLDADGPAAPGDFVLIRQGAEQWVARYAAAAPGAVGEITCQVYKIIAISRAVPVPGCALPPTAAEAE
jgi:hypothetical protein